LPELAGKEFVTRSLSRDLSLGCGIVVDRVEKSSLAGGDTHILLFMD